jgi:hypothetical protein
MSWLELQTLVTYTVTERLLDKGGVLDAKLDVLDARGNAVDDLLLGRGPWRLHAGEAVRLM